MARLTKYERWDRSNVVHRSLFGFGIANADDVLRTFEEAIITAGKLTLHFWFDRILPEHFERPAHNRYGYHKRRQRYIRYKLKRFPDSRGLDLILSGKFQKEALAPPRTVPTGRRIQNGFIFKVGLRTQPYIVKNQYVDMHLELTARDEEDTRRLFETFRTFVGFQLGIPVL